MLNHRKLFCGLALMITLFGGDSLAQRDIGADEITIKPKMPTPARKMPAAPRRIDASSENKGLLFVLTQPSSAYVLIKDAKGKPVKKGRSEDGEFRAELPAGVYEVTVTADEYGPYIQKALQVRAADSRIVSAELIPIYGSIIIGPVEPDAEIMIDQLKPRKVKVREKENQIEIEEVAAGLHTLTIRHPKIEDLWIKNLKVEGGAISYITPKYEIASGQLIVEAEPFTTVYMDEEEIGTTLFDGRLLRKGILAGKHDIKLTKAGFLDYKETVQFDRRKSVVIKPKLTEIVFASEFVVDFALFEISREAWGSPPNWAVQNSALKVKGPEPGLLKDYVYKDFKMEFDIKLLPGKGASWIVRAQDAKNYYLFQLTPKDDGRSYAFDSFLFQKGQAKLIKSVPVPIDISSPDDSLHIIVKALGKEIAHYMEAVSAPQQEPLPLDKMTDGSFNYGSVGFTGREQEEFKLFFLHIVPYPKTAEAKK